MKNLKYYLSFIIICLCIALCGCLPNKIIEFELKFIVDNQIYSTITTSGDESISLPTDPIKDGFVFDGWYWDNNVWQRPFTANSLLNEKLTSDMIIYAKFINTDSLSGVQVEFIDFTQTTDNNFNIKTSNATSSMNFTNIVKVSNCATWNLYRDIYCQSIIHDKTVFLNIGDNRYYVLVTDNANNGKLYTIDIRRRPIYKVVFFDTNGGFSIANQYIEEDSYISIPDKPTKPGYSFVSFSENINSPVISNTIINVNWSINVYKINYQLNDYENDGTNNENKITSITIEDEDIILNNPSRGEYYTFLGWYLDPNFTYRCTTITYGSTYYAVENNITLYARWQTIFNVNGSAITGINKEITHLIIPTHIKDCNVDTDITSIRGFYNCSTLTNITISVGITVIEEDAFYGCSSLTNITIPDSVTKIGSSAFYHCSSLTNITIPDSVTEIGDYAFSDCSSLTNITIHDGVNTIGNCAFDGCSNLTNVTIPDSVTKIDDYAFYGCSSLTNITIPDSITEIGYSVFKGCNSLTNVYYGGTLENWCNIKYNINPYHSYSSPMYYASHFFMKNNQDQWQEVTEIVIPNTITEIKSYTFYGFNNITNITIPNSITEIGDSAFSGCSSLQSITLPFVGNSRKTANDTYQNPFGSIFGTTSYTGACDVTQYYYGSSTSLRTSTTYCIPSNLKEVTITGGNILCGAFDNCSMLTNITISYGITEIGDSAFSGCSSLTNITIPNSVIVIEYHAFYNCTNLTNVYYVGIIEDWCNITFNNYVYNFESNPMYYASRFFMKDNQDQWQEVSEIIIPNTITEIKPYTFYGFNNITNITIPNSITEIGDYTFSGCSSLTDITIPNSVTEIGDSAFSGCSSLQSITLPFVGNSRNTTNDTKKYPFGYIFGTTSYTGSYETATFTAGYKSSPNSNTYYIPLSLKEVTITGGNILRGAFACCRSLTNIAIPSNSTEIGDYAFSDCRSLTNITIPDGVNTIGNCAFPGCTNLTNVTIPDSVTEIGSSAFSGPFNECQLTNIYYGGTIEDWCNITFNNSYSNPMWTASHFFMKDNQDQWQEVTEIATPDTITEIKQYTFYGFNNITNITIPNFVNKIDSSAFYGCSSLTNITIPDSITTIAGYAFHSCSSLTNITIPDSVTTIGFYCFFNCISLTNVYYGGTIEDWCNITFNDSYSNPMHYACHFFMKDNQDQWQEVTEIVIPNTITEIKRYTFYGFNNITSITIPNSVTKIEGYAFGGRNNFTNITIEVDINSRYWVEHSGADVIKDNLLSYINNGNTICIGH